jgi:Ca-activated chloride channel family protein
VSIEVTAFVARTIVEQHFVNPFDHPIEAVYTFPLGDRAAVDDFELTVGDRTIRGDIRRRDEARAVYQQAVAAGYQAALLEQERPNIFTQSVANLEPGKMVTVRLRTVETLRYERGIYRLAFPLVVGPRYVPGGGKVADAGRITPPVLPRGTRSGHDVAIDAGVPLRDLVSPSHKVVVQATGATTARIELADGDAIPNKDFQLRWSVASDRPAVGLLAHRDGADGFFTLLVQPKGDVSAREATPKEIVFVIDTSGSMHGVPLDASKRFIAKALHELGPRDTFNLIRFSGDNEVFSETPLPNDSAEIERAIAWVNRQQGGGGTEMLAALTSAFARPKDPNRLRVVIFLTDGYVGNDDEILGAIRGVLGDARIDTVGIGSSVNRSLLDRMADLGRGAFVAIRPDEAADDALEAFRSWVTRPYLTDLAIDWGALPVADMQPEALRDLGSGQTLTLVGRYLSAGAGDIVVRGRLGGRAWEQRLHVVLPEAEPRHAPLAALWARGRIEELLLASPGAITDSVQAEVTALALSYQLMSPFTSFVAVDDSVVVNPAGTAPTIHQALPLPEGVSFAGIFGNEGPAVLGVAGKDKQHTEDAPDGDGNPNVAGAREGDFKTVVGGVAGGVAGGVPGGAPLDSAKAQVARLVSPPPAPSAQPLTKFKADFIADLPVAGRFYQNVLALAPGVQEEHESNAQSEGVSTRDRLREAAVRLLADLADDGVMTTSEGRPALAALLGAQIPSGAIARDVTTQALATWALAEAAAATPKDPWLATAASKAADALASVKPDDAEGARWARLVLGIVRPAAVASILAPAGVPGNDYVRLRAAIAAARSGASTPPASGRQPFDRLVAAIARGKLKVMVRA